jgi:hypothetical protein
MTLLSCLTIGATFAIAVSLLVGAGLLIGWILPGLIQRRRGKDAPPRRRD